MTYKQVRYRRRSPQELAAWQQAYAAFLHQGYDKEVASQYAWDCFYAGRRGRKERVQA